MSFAAHSRSRMKRRQQGYAILFVLFLLTLLVLTTAAVAPNVLTEGRREREQEMIWRGHQYARGIKLYYRKTGKFPTSLDDLTKPKLGSIRFMRQAYKDPMNVADGEWRLIYVGPAGQLIGSLKPQRALQLSAFGAAQAVPAPNLTPNLSGMNGPGSIGSQPFGMGNIGGIGGQTGRIGAGGFSTFGNNTGAPNSAPGANQPIGSGPSNLTQPGGQDPPAETADAGAANEALLNSDPPVVMGGNIIGVGSKINHGSVIVYDQAKNYRQFEFIWDPSKDPLTIGGSATPQNGVLPGAPPNQAAPFGPAGAATPTALQPGTQQNQPAPNGPLEPQPMPPETAPNPPPQS